jgi:cell wall-associated NlpC family hydrolase
VPIHPPSIHAASNRSATTPSTGRSTHPRLRSHATRAAVVATTSAAAALLSVLPATATAPVAADTVTPAAAVTAPATVASVDAAVLLAAVPAPAAPALPVSTTPVEQVAVSAPAASAAAARASAVQFALSKVGSPYRWGATGPSAFDCSGLVNWAFEKAGIDVPRTSRALSQVGTPVARGDLQPGDLVFFYKPVSHVGIYIGDGQMVHASTSRKPVAVSSIEGRQYNSARRL